MKFLFLLSASLVSAQLDSAISRGLNEVSSFSNQWVSWIAETPATPYTSHTYRINGNTLSPYFTSINAILSRSSSSGSSLVSSEVSSLAALDALLADAFDEVLVYIDHLCSQSVDPVAAVGYYNVLYTFFSTQVSYFNAFNTKCDSIASYYSGYSRLESAFEHIAQTSLITQYCYQTLTKSNYAAAPSVVLCSTTASSTSSPSSSSSSSSTASSTTTSSPSSTSSPGSGSSTSSTSSNSGYVESTQTWSGTAQRCLAKVKSSATATYISQELS